MGLYDEELGRANNNSTTIERTGGLYDEELGRTSVTKPTNLVATPQAATKKAGTIDITKQVLPALSKNDINSNGSLNIPVTSSPSTFDGLKGIVSLSDNRRFNDRFSEQNRYSSLSEYNAKHAEDGTNKGLKFRVGQVGHALRDIPTFGANAFRDIGDDLSGFAQLGGMLLGGMYNAGKSGVNALIHPKQTLNKIFSDPTQEQIDVARKSTKLESPISFIARNVKQNYETIKSLPNNLNKIRRSEIGHGFQEALKEQYGQSGKDMIQIGQDGKPIRINVDAPGLLQAVYAHPFNTALDLGLVGLLGKGAKYLSSANKSKKYLKSSNNASMPNKAKNSIINALDKATTANPNVADKVSKIADTFGYDASKLNDTTSKMHEFNQLVKEGELPRYSKTQEEAIEHSKLANEEQSSKLIDELTHGIEEQNTKPNETVEEFSQRRFGKPADDLTQDEFHRFLDEYKVPQKENVSPEPSQDTISHVKNNSGHIAHKVQETANNEPTNLPKVKKVKTNNDMFENYKRNTGEETNVIKPSEKIIKLESGTAEGADTLNRLTKGKDTTFENIAKGSEAIETHLNPDAYNKEFLGKLKTKYDTKQLEDGSYALVYRENGHLVPYKEVSDLRKKIKNAIDNATSNGVDADVDRFMNSIFSEDDFYKYGNGTTEIMSPNRQIKENLWEVKEPSATTKYPEDTTPEFKKWYDKYLNSTDEEQVEMLSVKIRSFNNKQEVNNFMRMFSETEDRMNGIASKSVKIGDDIVDASDVSNTRKLTNAVNEHEDYIDKLDDGKEIGETYTNKNLIKWANDHWDNILRNSSNKKTKFTKVYRRQSGNKWVADNEYNIKEGISSYLRGEGDGNVVKIQKLYDKTTNRILASNDIPPSVKEVMLNQLDNTVDAYFKDEWSKKPWNEGKDIPEIQKYSGARTSEELKRIQEKDFINFVNNENYSAAGRELYDKNIKYKYASKEAQECIDKYFEHRLDEMNNILFIDKNGKPDFKKILNAAMKNKEKGVVNVFNRTKNSIRRPQNYNALSQEEKIQILDNAFDRYQRVLDKNKKIIDTDIKKFLYDSNRLQSKTKYNQSTGKYEKTGDSFDSTFSGVFDKNDADRLVDNHITKYQKLVDDYKKNIGKIKTNIDLEKIADNYFKDSYINGRKDLHDSKILAYATRGIKRKYGNRQAIIKDFDEALASAKKNFAKDYQEKFLSGEHIDNNVIELEKRLKDLDNDDDILYSYKERLMTENEIDTYNPVAEKNYDIPSNIAAKHIVESLKNGGDSKTLEGFNTTVKDVLDLDDTFISPFIKNNSGKLDLGNIKFGIRNLKDDTHGCLISGNNEIHANSNNFNKYGKQIINHEVAHSVIGELSKNDKYIEDIHNTCVNANNELKRVRKLYGSYKNAKKMGSIYENEYLSAWGEYVFDTEEQFVKGCSRNTDIYIPLKDFDNWYKIERKNIFNECQSRFRTDYEKYEKLVEDKVDEYFRKAASNDLDRGKNQWSVKGSARNDVQKGVWDRTEPRNRTELYSTREDFSGVPKQPKSVADSKPIPFRKITKYDLKDVDFGKSYNAESARKAVVSMSKESEDIGIELGLIEAKQAENKILKQSKTNNKDKVYIKGKYKTKEGIDLNKDYNSSANTKEGLFGKTKKDGSNIQGSAEDITRNAANELNHRVYTKKTTDYIANNFALPIENGKIKDGYVGVNRTLLNNMVHGRFSSEWYKTLEAGEETIRKSFKDEGVANAWVELSKKTQNYDFQIPKAVFDTLADGKGENAAVYWDRYARLDNPRGLAKGAGKFLGALSDAMLNGFKRRVLASGSFVLNNRLGNQTMIYMTSKNPIEYLKTFYGATKLKDSDLPIELIQSNIAEAAKDSLTRQTYTGNNAVDNAINLFNGQLIDTKSLKNIKEKTAKGANIVIGLPNKAFNKVAEAVMNFNAKGEIFERKQVFYRSLDRRRLELIKKTGQTLVKDAEVLKYIKENSEITEAVIREVEDALGNYRTFNKFEKNVMKRIIPFYSWYRTIARHTVKLATTHPEKIARVRLELMAIGIDNRGDYSKKKYQRHSVDLGKKDSRSGKELVINKEHANPYNTFRDDVGYNPYLQTLVEMKNGKKNFLNGEITNDRYIRQSKYDGRDRKTAYYDLKNGDWLRDNKGNIKYEEDYDGKFIKGALPMSTRFGYGLKTLAKNTIAPYIDNQLVNVEHLYGAIDNALTKDANKKEKGKFIPYDKSYDASIGGYNNGDVVGSKVSGKKKQRKDITRFASNDLSAETRTINMLGFGIQNKAELNKKERAEYKERSKRIKQRMKKSK